ESGEEIFRPLEHSHWVTSVAYAPRNDFFVTASWNREMRIWDAATGDPPADKKFTAVLEKPASPVQSMAFSPDGQRIAAACQDQTVVIWDLMEMGKIVRTFPANSGQVRSVFFGYGGQLLASVDFDLMSPQNEVLQGPDALLAATFAQPEVVAAASADGTILLWKLSDDAAPRVFKGHTGPV